MTDVPSADSAIPTATSSTAPARHGRRRGAGRTRRILSFIGAGLAVVLVSGAALAGIQIIGFTSRLNVVDIGTSSGGELPQIGAAEGGFNILITGVDSREGRNAAFGPDEGAELNDVNILVHISEDHSAITVVSFPRDMIVPIPSCDLSDGRTTSAMSAQAINVAWSTGGGSQDAGLACVAKTVSTLTGLDIDYAAMTTFFGVIDMSTAIGGVDVCITGGDLYDPYAFTNNGPLSLSEGLHTLSGWDALAYLRSRHGVGNGGDLGRISSQQAFLSSLLRKVTSDGTLTDPAAMYNLANTAVDNMQLSSTLASPDTMIALARILAGVDLDKVSFVTYPNRPDPTDPNRLVPDRSGAADLIAQLEADQVVVPDQAGEGSSVETTPSGEGTETEPGSGGGESGSGSGNIRGQLASQVSCSVANN